MPLAPGLSKGLVGNTKPFDSISQNGAERMNMGCQLVLAARQEVTVGVREKDFDSAVLRAASSA